MSDLSFVSWEVRLKKLSGEFKTSFKSEDLKSDILFKIIHTSEASRFILSL